MASGIQVWTTGPRFEFAGRDGASHLRDSPGLCMIAFFCKFERPAGEVGAGIFRAWLRGAGLDGGQCGYWPHGAAADGLGRQRGTLSGK